MSGWISVSDSLPTNELEVVLVRTKDRYHWEQVFAAWPGIDEDEPYWLLDHPFTLDSKNGDVRIPGVVAWMHVPSK